MRLTALVCASAFIAAGCATSSTRPNEASSNVLSAYAAPKLGTIFTVKYYPEGETTETFEQMIVANGEDYAVYAVIDEQSESPSKDLFFIEYSGLYWQACGDIQPNDDERQALQNMWPLAAGNSAMMSSTDLDGANRDVRVEINAITTQITEQVGETPVAMITANHELPELTTYAPALSTSLKIDWGMPGSDSYAGYDELTSIRQADPMENDTYIQFAKQNCLPS